MKWLFSAMLALAGAVFAGGALDDYAFFAQWTVASHEDGSQNRWPCMARLADGRILLVWSRLDAKGEDAIVAGVSKDAGCSWAPPKALISHDGVIDADPSIVVSGSRVLVTCTSADFSQGIRTSTTWCVRSEDGGETWSTPYEIPMGRRYTCGKTHHGLRLASGTLLMGYSWDALCEEGRALSSEGEMDLRAGVMRSIDDGDTWTNGGDTNAPYEKVSDGAVRGTDEPAIVELEDGSIYMLMRTGATHLYEARSDDEGRSWRDVGPSPLKGTNAPAALTAFDVAGRRGLLAVWDNARQRFPLCAAASFDGGRTWSPPKDIAFPYTGGQASYPSCEQAADGTLLAVWQQDVPGGRDVRLARFSLAWLLEDAAASWHGALAEVVLPDEPRWRPGYDAAMLPDAAEPAWQVHRSGGVLDERGRLKLAPMGGYYIDNQADVWNGARDTLVEARMRVVRRDGDAADNHSAAELWIGGPEPNTSCSVFFREDAVAFNDAYVPSFPLEATAFHTYRVLTDRARARAYLFVDDGAAPILGTALGAPYGHNIDRILFGDSGSAMDVSGESEWALVRWADVELATPAPESEPRPTVRLVAFGDSTTASRGPLHVFAGLLEEAFPAMAVINAGGPGNTTVDARARFEQDVLGRNPDIVTIAFGINDSAVDVRLGAVDPRVSLDEFEANLRYFVTTLRDRAVKSILMTPNPLAWTPPLEAMYGKPPYDPEDPNGFNVLLAEYAERVRQVAATEVVPLVDVYRLFSERTGRGDMRRLLLDGMHPNDVGHHLIAEAVGSVITGYTP